MTGLKSAGQSLSPMQATSGMSLKILLVDDEAKILSAYRRAFRQRFELDTASSGKAALSLLENSGPYAVIVTDMRMPAMDGLEFLGQAKKRAPHSVRIMLTGNTDQQTAIDAVNQGSIFRFHTKPCPAENLGQSIEDGFVQYEQSLAVAAESEQLNSENQLLADRLGDAEEKADQACKVQAEFLAGINHELRTPLNHIVGFSELMKSQIFGRLDERYADYAGHILDSANHLSTQVNTLLEYSKAAAGSLELRTTKIPLAGLLKRSITKAKTLVCKDERVVEMNFPDSLPNLVGDEHLIEQLFVSLISNALKFSTTNDKVLISAEQQDQHCSRVSIQDTGIGISAEDMEKVLQPFTQVEMGLNRRFDGVGIGLPLAKALAELHGGTLTLQSELGVGTTITVSLPHE